MTKTKQKETKEKELMRKIKAMNKKIAEIVS